jgi:hypothetical protein
MSMAFGLVGESRAKVQPGTVIALTKQNLKADPKDQSNTAIKAIYDSYRPAPVYRDNQIGPTGDVRNQILYYSLFPNTVNSKKTYNAKDTGAFRG